jgi:SAM-dependent methyltransferase
VLSFPRLTAVSKNSVNNPKPLRPAGAPSSSDLYNEGYFHGQSSGYPREGYRSGRPDWAAWLDFMRLVKPAGVLLDVGCAYGYLVNTARQRGYRAFGLDISPFALRQEPSFRAWLLGASAVSLPFKDGSADVIALFDVLEHLDNPNDCLTELRRVLKDDGLLLGATPDPVFFDRVEPTHVSEKPPSFWLAVLRSLGLEVRFRFSGEAYNFQFVAAPTGSSSGLKLDLFQHDYFDEGVADIIQVQEQASELVDVVLRSGWGPRNSDGRELAAFPAVLYLLNRCDQPLTVRFTIRIAHTPAFSTLRIRLDSYVISEICLDSEQVERTVQPEDILLPPGGHHLFFDLFPGGPEVTVQSIGIEAQPTSHARLVAGLPFDLFQRYRLSSDIARILGPQTVLDIGGYLGDENGHLAVTHDFFQPETRTSPQITVTDLRQCDHPDYWKAPASRQPFADSGFDLVMSLDVLEHLPETERKAFLEELDRLSCRWILLGAPFASMEVEKAEAELAESVMQTRHFLNEHRELGLPTEAFVRDFYLSRGYTVRSFPNGYLPSWLYWQVTTQHYFALNDYDITGRYNSLYGTVFYPADNREPAYRHILLISKSPLGPGTEAKLAEILPRKMPGDDRIEGLGSQPAFLEIHERINQLTERRRKALTDVQFLINERQKLIGLLEREVEELKRLEARPLWRKAWDRLREKIR